MFIQSHRKSKGFSIKTVKTEEKATYLSNGFIGAPVLQNMMVFQCSLWTQMGHI